MESVFYLIFWIVIGIITAILHKRKGYSPIAGFLWGFLFSVLGLLIVVLEKDKAEHDAAKEKGEKSIGFWLAIFVGGGSLLLILAFIILSML